MESFGDPVRIDVPHRGVGFLRRGEPFDVGDVDAAVFEKLCELTQDPWIFQPQAGVHWCDLCRFTGNSMASYQNPRGLSYRVSAASSCGPMVVPGRGLLYLVPTNVTHYIDAHGFRPSDEFCQAVLDCPPMRSMGYWKAVLSNGGRALLAAVKAAQPM